MANQVDLLLLAHDERDIYDEEILILNAIHRNQTTDTFHLKYNRFSLQNTRERECISEFRFHKEGIPVL